MINWRAAPFIRLLIPLVFGILLAGLVPASLPAWSWPVLIALLATAHSFTAFRIKWVFGIITFSFIAALGYQLSFFHNELNRKDHFRFFLEDTNKLIGHIIRPPQINKTVGVRLCVSHLVGENNEVRKVSGKLMLYMEPDSLSLQLQYGDQLLVESNIKAIPPPRNPKAFDFQKYMHIQNLHYQSFAGKGKFLLLAQNKGNALLSLSSKMQNILTRLLQANLPTENEYAVGAALILGNRNEISEEIKNAYAQTGAIHVLAVSGMHVGLFAWFVSLLLSLKKSGGNIWRWVKTAILILSLWSFALITGASASVMRAAFMFSLVLIAFGLQRIPNIYNIIAASAFCILVFNPFLLLDVGFQLSYLAVVGIVYFTPKIYRSWYIKNKAGSYLWKLGAVAIAAQISTFPVSIYYFHQFPLYFLFSSLAVVPLAPIILTGGILLFIFAQVPLLGWLLSKLLYWSIWLMNSLIFLIHKLPGNLIEGFWTGMVTTILLYLLLMFIAVSVRSKNFRWMVGSAAALFLLSATYAFRSIEQDEQRQIVIYHLYQNSLIDFIEGEHIISLSDKTISPAQINRAARNYRWFTGARKITQVVLGNEKINSKTLIYYDAFIQFYDKRLVIIDRPIKKDSQSKLKADWIIIRNNPILDIDELDTHFEFNQIIFDGSNTPANIKRWVKTCNKNNWNHYSTSNSGALVIHLKA